MLTQEQIDGLTAGDMIRLRDMEYPLHHIDKLTYDGSSKGLVVDVGGGELHGWPPENCELVEG